MLLLKKIPHARVEVSMTLPRPELSEIMGITYRRIPILAIGRDIYADTSLIASTLERRYPASAGYGSLFPPREGGGPSDTGMAKALAMYYFDRTIFPLAASSLPFDKFPEAFLKDRADYMDKPINLQALPEVQQRLKSELACHVSLLEEQLSDGRGWLFDTEAPGLVDISSHILFGWIVFFKHLRDLFDPKTVPHVIAWIGRLREYLKTAQDSNIAPVEKVTSEQALKLVQAGDMEDHAGFDAGEAGRLGLVSGQTVAVTPTDTGKNHPTVGTLIGLNREEVVIQVKGTCGTLLHVHFPRLGFAIRVHNAKL
ncbi:hypothetical protein BDM02DRAFT_3163906 [Thelephora ganbajun]|uniref:Uncharacterized protein n=1 Tax=Thelephora ganbajun TaxID=370292 RepID=A0ACB6ZNM4_THEGA|nr:hypothetical protein BDM02DRAFT_3163906 [Thelephora ganbajun]